MPDAWWPATEDLSISLSRAAYSGMYAEELGAYVQLVWAIATQSVNTYTAAKANPSLPDDDKLLARMTFSSRRRWTSKLRPAVIGHFIVDGGRWYLKDDDVIRISRRSTRNPIPMAVKSAAMARDGQRCSYCGNTDGPFHFDHLYPVSKGGADVAHNIVIACVPCNLSKGDKTILEWVDFLRGRQ
jgi:hypothetical protein